MRVMNRIESRNNGIINAAAALSKRAERYENRRFTFEGVHLLEEFLRAGHSPCAVFVREDRTRDLSRLLNTAGCEVYEVTAPVYDKLTSEQAPQGVFTVAEFLDNIKDFGGFEPCGTNTLLLDNLQDPGNVGTAVRTATALGARVVLASCADIYSQKTVRASMGSVFFGDITVCRDSAEAIESLKNSGLRVIAAALYGKNEKLGGFDILPDDCFVIGNEGGGLSEKVLSMCDFSSRIPMTCGAESFNAAAAAAIFLWEAKRKTL